MSCAEPVSRVAAPLLSRCTNSVAPAASVGLIEEAWLDNSGLRGNERGSDCGFPLGSKNLSVAGAVLLPAALISTKVVCQPSPPASNEVAQQTASASHVGQRRYRGQGRHRPLCGDLRRVADSQHADLADGRRIEFNGAAFAIGPLPGNPVAAASGKTKAI